jgi:hypothetical protein
MEKNADEGCMMAACEAAEILLHNFVPEKCFDNSNRFTRV